MAIKKSKNSSNVPAHVSNHVRLQRFLSVFSVMVVLATGLTGCGGIRVANQVANTTSQGEYDSALELLEKKKNQYSGANNLLYYFEKGSLLQRIAEYQSSIKELNAAEKLVAELYGTSVTQAAASFLVNDMTMDYVGEDFEQIMVHVLKELDFLYMNKLSGALVEARKVNTRLVKLADKYGKDAIYKQDAFARYMAAFALEADGEYNSAYIDYKLAYKGFLAYQEHYGMPVPELIKKDLIRLSRWMGFGDQHRKWKQAFGDEFPDAGKRPRKRSEVLIVVYDGLIPAKKTKKIAAPIHTPDGKPYVLKVAFPAFQKRCNVVDHIRLGLPDGTVVESEVMEPLDAIATKNLEQRIGLISVKAIARATTKYIAAYQARKAAGDNLAVNILSNVYTYATEQADTRSWRTLPNKFHLLRTTLPPGEHTLELRVKTVRGSTISLPPITVNLKKGRKKVIPLYVPR